MRLPKLPKYFLRALLGLVATGLLLANAVGVIDIGLVKRLELISYDARVRLTMPGGKDQRVVIVDLDEKSLAEVGRWPWGRDQLAKLVQTLFERHQIAVLGFDVLFAEPDNSSGLDTLSRLARGPLRGDGNFNAEFQKIAPALDHDAIFAQTIAKYPVVLSTNFDFTRPKPGEHLTAGILPKPVLRETELGGRKFDAFVGKKYTGNLPDLVAHAAAGGHFNSEPEVDGVIRRTPMLVKYGHDYYEALSLAMVRLLYGSPQIVPVMPAAADASGYDAIETLRVGATDIPVGDRVTALIPFRGGQRSFRYVSATDVLHHRLPAQELNGAIVLVGTTAAGLFDLRSTSVATVYPGVELHANLIAGMLDGTFKQQPPYALGIEIMLLLVLGLLLSFGLPRMAPLIGTLSTLGILGLLIGSNLYAWKQNTVWPLASPLALVIAIFGINMTYGFFVERRAKRQITGLFGQYIPRELVDEMSQNPDNIRATSENRELTVLFSDVRNFTTISEGLEPQALSELMNEYLTPMTRIIHKHRGTIDKYMGDAIMAFWGAPLDDKKHVDHALAAAMEMVSALHKLGPEFKARGWPELRIGVGLNTGSMSVGNMGSEFRRAYTVMGDAVNLGSRLEGLTKEYGVEIMVGEVTKEKADNMLFRQLDRVRVKGKDEPVSIYEPMGRLNRVSQAVKDEVAQFHEVLFHYFSQEWAQGLSKLEGLLANQPEVKLYKVYQGRMQEFLEHPPGADWDGVYTHKTK